MKTPNYQTPNNVISRHKRVRPGDPKPVAVKGTKFIYLEDVTHTQTVVEDYCGQRSPVWYCTSGFPIRDGDVLFRGGAIQGAYLFYWVVTHRSSKKNAEGLYATGLLKTTVTERSQIARLRRALEALLKDDEPND